jgi:hypothetical protein
MSVRPAVPSARRRVISASSASRTTCRLRTKRPQGDSQPKSYWNVGSAMNGALALLACPTNRSTSARKGVNTAS